MRVLIVNTSERAGGVSVAAGRLMDALNNNGVKTKMLVRYKEKSLTSESILSLFKRVPQPRRGPCRAR